MTITNKTKNALLSEDTKIAKSFIERTLGLILKKDPQALILYTNLGIHTFGMRFPIDVIILNKQNSVVAMKENLLPSRIFLWNLKYSTVIELPHGTIVNSKTKLGDIIEIR